MYYVIVGTLGACLALAMALLVRARLFYLAGLAPLFPAFAVLAHLLTIQSGSRQGLRVAATFGLYSLLAYGSYLAGVLILSRTLSALLAIACSIAIWFVVALALAEAWRRGWLPGALQ